MTKVLETNPYTRILESDPFGTENNILYYQNISLCLADVAQHYNNTEGDDIYMGYSELSEQVQSLSDLYAELYHTEEDIKELKTMIHTEFCSVLVDLEDYFESFPDEITNRDIEFGKIFLQAFTL
jgi:hypothetical protein